MSPSDDRAPGIDLEALQTMVLEHEDTLNRFREMLEHIGEWQHHANAILLGIRNAVMGDE